jgi:hypothetical protein
MNEAGLLKKKSQKKVGAVCLLVFCFEDQGNFGLYKEYFPLVAILIN